MQEKKKILRCRILHRTFKRSPEAQTEIDFGYLRKVGVALNLKWMWPNQKDVVFFKIAYEP